MEASGQARWFERLLSELHFELWIGDAAEIRTKRVPKSNIVATRHKQCYTLLLWPKHHQP
jgi:hypothetical protein